MDGLILDSRSYLLLAFGFGNLAMLGWLAAAAAPLLIHLWSRRRYREVPWAAVTFLLAAVRKHSRRIQLQQWLLLAIRTLIILLVVMAVAEPYGGEFARSFTAPTHRVLVIDTSFSMACRDAEISRLGDAKRLATELVAESGPGDAFTVITLSDRPREIVDRHGVDRASIGSRIDEIQQSHGRADLSATLNLVSAALLLEAEEVGRFEQQEICFFTDLQRGTWGEGEKPSLGPSSPQPVFDLQRTGISEAGIAGHLAEIAGQARVRLIDLGSPRTSNLAITELQLDAPFVTVGRDVEVVATLHEFGDQPRAACAVEFLADGVPVGQQTVDVPAGGNATARFRHGFRDPGSHTVAARAAGDRLDIDNIRWLAVSVDERIEVLCVAGAPGAAEYIAAALDPDQSDDSPIRVRVIGDGELVETELAPFECVFLCNVAQFTADEAVRLSRYVEEGGGLAIFLGDRVLATAYNDMLGDDGSSILPAQLGDVLAGSQLAVDPLDYRHPIAVPFRGRERAGLISSPIGRYFQLRSAATDRPMEVALAMASGDPLIVTAPLGRGRTVLVATAGSLSSIDRATGQPWTTWPAWPSFLPVVREILDYAVGGHADEWRSLVGAPLVGAASPTFGRGEVEIERPDGRTATIQIAGSADGSSWRYSDTDVSGIYTARSETSAGAELVQRFAVNVDTQESDLTQVDAANLPAELHVQQDLAGTSGDAGRGALSRAPWHRSLLWTALGLLFVELCLAWQFGRGTA